MCGCEPGPLLLLLVPLLIACEQTQAGLVEDERHMAHSPLSNSSQPPTSLQKKSHLADQ